MAVAILAAGLSGNTVAQNTQQSSVETPSQPPAQAASLDLHLDTARQLLMDIDSSAQACIEDSIVDACTTFALVLDETFIGTYLEHCQVVTDWVESLIAGLENEETETSNDVVTSQRLLAAEFACGDQAVVKRTTYVTSAFAKWQAANPVSNNRGLTQSNYRAKDIQIAESVRTQQSRLNQEIRQQWQQVELENLRQQLNSRVNYGGSTFPR